MEDGDREKYHVISRIQDFVFYSKKMGCIRFFSSQVYNKDWYQTSKLSNYKICAHMGSLRENLTLLHVRSLISPFVIHLLESISKLAL